jgi:large subunit ribosomal protein L38e
LPREIFDESEFLELAEKSIHCRVKRLRDEVKLKLRTKKTLYTYKTSPEEAERLLKSVNCEIIEL